MYHPPLVFAISFLGLSLSTWSGKFFSRNQPTNAEALEGFGVVQAATLTLLGLIIGFSFSMALGRYDQRKACELSEANAIGTEYLRADLLPAADDAVKVRALLLNYLDQRVLFYNTSDEQRLLQIEALTSKLEVELWSAVHSPAVAQAGPVAALAVAGLNDVLNSRGFTQGAWWNRIPIAAWTLMVAIAMCSHVMIGFRERRNKPIVLLILPLVVSITFLLIADIDTPRGGLIRVIPQNLISLSQSLHGK
jgi:hypothetical protein